MKDLDQILRVLSLKQQQSLQDYAQLLEQEAVLRRKISELKMTESEYAAPENSDLRQVGADLAFSRWSGDIKLELNLRLSRVLAAKEQKEKRVRMDTGRLEAAKEVAKSMARNKR